LGKFNQICVPLFQPAPWRLQLAFLPPARRGC